tara:strand:+ start:794 stop:1453 length:660 start_codon:yes stop_codon:yes gene_type:complete
LGDGNDFGLISKEKLEVAQIKELSFSKDLRLIMDANPGKNINIASILQGLDYRSHGIIVMILSLPFVIPMPIMGLSTLFGSVMMISAISIMSGLSPWIPKKWRGKTVPRETMESLILKSEKVATKIERFVKPRFLLFSKSWIWIRIHGLMILVAAFILALPSPPGGNVLPGAATFVLALGLVEEDGIVLILGYLLTALNVILLTLILVYGLDWLMSFFT